MLRGDDGNCISDPGELLSMVFHFLTHELYKADSLVRQPLERGFHPCLSDVDRFDLEINILPHEVRTALKPCKAPGVSGCKAGFYQECWDTVGPTLIDLVQQAFTSGVFNEHLRRTLLLLIPKVQNPEFTRQLRPISLFIRPISLCTVTYKLITKVLLNRLRPIFR